MPVIAFVFAGCSYELGGLAFFLHRRDANHTRQCLRSNQDDIHDKLRKLFNVLERPVKSFAAYLSSKLRVSKPVHSVLCNICSHCAIMHRYRTAVRLPV